MEHKALLEDIIEQSYFWTTKIETAHIKPNDILIGLISLGTKLAIGFVFKQNGNNREILKQSLFCCSFTDGPPLPYSDLFKAIQLGLKEKLNNFSPQALEAIENHFALQLLRKWNPEWQTAKAQEGTASEHDFLELYQIELERFKEIFRVKEAYEIGEADFNLGFTYNPNFQKGAA